MWNGDGVWLKYSFDHITRRRQCLNTMGQGFILRGNVCNILILIDEQDGEIKEKQKSLFCVLSFISFRRFHVAVIDWYCVL